MSWFYYGWQDVRKKRKGILLRPFKNPDVMKAIRESGLMRLSDHPWRIEVCELRDDDKVLLEVWCKSLFDAVMDKRRNNVFHLLVPENPDWVCEGDQGRGLK